MPLADADQALVEAELGRDLTVAEELLFENLWSEHCAYRSSRPLLSAFESEGPQVVVGPGDDAAVVAVPAPDDLVSDGSAPDDLASDGSASVDGDATDTYLTFGIESHNHPSYVDPYDGAATGVGGIVRDTMSMGAYPIALADCLYFGDFDDEHSRYLFEGVVEGISDYGNAIGVPTVGGSVAFHEGYEGNPLVNVACVGLTTPDRLVTADATGVGNKLVLVGNATGRDGLGGASFASEDLGEDAETEDRPAVQVGDPYTEKLLVECNEALVDEGLVEAARDLGAAGLGGATSEMVAKGGTGADIALDRVHQREPDMSAAEILLAESQERMCYEVEPENVERVRELADRFDLGCSVIGEVTEGNYVCTFQAEGATERETVVDAPAEFLADGAPMNDLARESPPEPETDLPEVDPQAAVEAVLADPTTASKAWVYRQYDHEVGVRTAVAPGDDAAVLALRETADGAAEGAAPDGTGLAISAGAVPEWTDCDPGAGARAIALENATNLAAKGARPLAAVDCLNGGNPEKPEVYGGFADAVDGLAEMCEALSVPVVGGNVSLYNDSVAGPIPPTPTLAMLGARSGYHAPPAASQGEGELLLVGAAGGGLGGSRYLAAFGGSDAFPDLPEDPAATVAAVCRVADLETTLATHDVSDGGLAVALAELVTEQTGVEVDVESVEALFDETPGRVLVETSDPGAVREAVGDAAPVARLGTATRDGRLSVSVDGQRVEYRHEDIASLRGTIADTMD